MMKILVNRHFQTTTPREYRLIFTAHILIIGVRQLLLFVEETMLIRQRVRRASLRSLSLPPPPKKRFVPKTERHFRLGISSLRSRFKESREPPSLVTLTQSDSSPCVSVYPGFKVVEKRATFRRRRSFRTQPVIKSD